MKRARKVLEEIKYPESLEFFSAWLLLLKHYQSLLRSYLSEQNFEIKNEYAIEIQDICFTIYANLIDFVNNVNNVEIKTVYQELHQYLCILGKYFDELQQSEECKANPALISRRDFTPAERAQQCYRSANTIVHALIQAELDTEQPGTALFDRIATLLAIFLQNHAMPEKQVSAVLFFIKDLLSASVATQIIDDFFVNNVASWQDRHDDYTTLARLMALIVDHSSPFDILPNCLLRTYLQKHGCERLKEVSACLVSQVSMQYLYPDALDIIINRYTPTRVAIRLGLTSKNENSSDVELGFGSYWSKALRRQYPAFIKSLAVPYDECTEFKKLIIKEQKELRLWAKIFSHELSEQQLAYLMAIRHGDLRRVAKFPHDDSNFYRLIFKSIYTDFNFDENIKLNQLDQRFVIGKSIIEWVRYRGDQEMLDLLYKLLKPVLFSMSASPEDARKNIIYLATNAFQSYEIIKRLMAPDMTLSTCDASRFDMNIFQIIMASGNHKVVWEIIQEHTQGNKLGELKLLLSPPQRKRISLHIACGLTGDSLRLVKFIDELFPEQRNTLQADGSAAITQAVMLNKFDVVAYLLKCGIDWGRQQMPQTIPLARRLIVKYIKDNNFEMARMLINSGASCSLIDLLNWNVFSLPSSMTTNIMPTFISVILILHANNPECIYETNPSRQTPLTIAARMNIIEVVTCLLNCGIEWQRLELLESPRSVQSLIVNCILCDNLEMAHTLINAGAPCTLIDVFELINYIFVLKRPFSIKQMATFINVILVLHARNPGCLEETNSFDETPLIIAIKKDIPVIDTLLKLNANINAINFSGKTPLCYAVMQRQINCVRTLLKYRPSYLVNEKINNQESTVDVLSYFIINKYASLSEDKSFNIKTFIQALVDAQYNINVMGDNGDTPLWHAVTQQDYDLIAALLDCGANINRLYGKDKMTILHYAVKCIDQESSPDLGIIKLLVEQCPALMNVRTVAGLTPLALAQTLASADLFSEAKDNPRNEIVAYLEKVSASMLAKPSESASKRMPPGLRLFAESSPDVQTSEDVDDEFVPWMPGTP